MSDTLVLPFMRVYADGEQFVDVYGIVREYDYDSNSFISKGTVKAPPLVSSNQDGLMTPKTFNLIRRIDDVGDLKTTLKIDGLPLAYFYLLHSTDDLIRFYPEARDKIRIEVDRGRLYQKILRNVCPGSKGDDGPEGVQGRTGRRATNEIRRRLTLRSPTEATTVAQNVSIPLDVPISARLFKSTELIAEMSIVTVGSEQGKVEFKQISEEIIIDQDKTVVGTDFHDDVADVLLDLTLSEGEFNQNFYVKVRQMGPTGDEGQDGENFLVVTERLAMDEFFFSDRMVVHLRKSGTSDDVLASTLRPTAVNCVLGLRPSQITDDLDVTTLWTAALPIASTECKDVCYFTFDPKPAEAPLNLLHWTPMKQCADRLRHGTVAPQDVCDISTFDWVPGETCETIPFKIAIDPRPPELCCQEDLFTCFNKGDSPCVVEGQPTPPRRFEKKGCECDCTPSTELLQVSGPIERAYQCSINGKIDQWQQEIEFDGPKTQVVVSIKFNDECESTGACEFTSNVIPCCISEGLQMDDAIVAMSNEGEVTLIVEGVGSLRLDVEVNLEKANCCQGYDLTFKAEPI